ncbi:MAG: DNA-protecting protein DprA [SAR202 cluster bacterium]|nr:DNA-protecting protein DprA [SAR202 cluster bacterium]
MTALKYWVALNRISGLGPRKFEGLATHFGDLGLAWGARASELEAAGLSPEQAAQVVRERSSIDPDDEMARMERAGVTAVARPDAGYPVLLKEIYDPPPVLYLRGTHGLTSDNGLAVVGTRSATPYGREVTARLVTELVGAGLTIVSGLAKGIDGVAHRSALDAGGRTLAVIGSGLDTIYPPEHRSLADAILDRGALITEFPLGHRIEPANFVRRNRILSGLTRGTLVTEAGIKSGALITVKFALEQNRDVFAVPGSILSSRSAGTNWLIQQGARPVTSAADVLEDLRLTTGSQFRLPVSEIEGGLDEAVLASVSDEPVHINDVIRTSGLPSATVSAALTMMELRGLVRQAGPLHYSRVRGLGIGSNR